MRLDPADPIDQALMVARDHLNNCIGDGRATITTTVEGGVAVEIESAMLIREEG